MDEPCWPFADPPESPAYVTTRVLDGSKPLRYVLRNEGGEWEFLCGTTNAKRNVRLSCLGDLVEQFPHVRFLSEMPEGYAAEWLEARGCGRRV